ncbi:MAG: MoaD/ThiS family protein [Pseudohongiella sp.]|uniref:MoaD/ThiS family protein n=1 Tax=Pseudohongiella sp. TaxID=1979412 RepID=UPI0034A00E93
MARLIVNTVFRNALGAQGAALSEGDCLELQANSVRNLLAMLDHTYPGSRKALAGAAMAIDGDIYHDALTEPLRADSELVFIHPIEGG